MAAVITFKPSCPLVPLFQQRGTTSHVRAQPLSCKADRQRSPRATFYQGTPRVSKAKAISLSARKRVVVPQAVVSAVPSLTRPPDVVGANWRKELRRRVSESFPEGGLIYLEAGEQQSRNGTDGVSPFRQESNFLYMTGVGEPDHACLLDTESGHLTIFAPTIEPSMIVWHGAIPSFEEIGNRYGAEACLPKNELPAVLRQHNPQVIYTLPGVNLPEGIDISFKMEDKKLQPAVALCRTVKIPEEVACLRYANHISGGGHQAIWEAAAGGSQWEYELEAAFVGHTLRHGLKHLGYPCIVGAGPNAATLHYDKNIRHVAQDELVLVDAGAEWGGYTADITRTFPAGGVFGARQLDVYNAVLQVQEAALAQIKPGASWEAVSWEARRRCCECLLDLGLVQGDVESLLENDITQLFFPHGLGHHLGLQVHDVGPKGPLPEVLTEGNVVTCEPGIYFIDAILKPIYEDKVKHWFLKRDAIEAFKSVGGVRIEDDVLVTSSGIDNLTTVAKRARDIEEFMRQ